MHHKHKIWSVYILYRYDSYEDFEEEISKSIFLSDSKINYMIFN